MLIFSMHRNQKCKFLLNKRRYNTLHIRHSICYIRKFDHLKIFQVIKIFVKSDNSSTLYNQKEPQNFERILNFWKLIILQSVGLRQNETHFLNSRWRITFSVLHPTIILQTVIHFQFNLLYIENWLLPSLYLIILLTLPFLLHTSKSMLFDAK